MQTHEVPGWWLEQRLARGRRTEHGNMGRFQRGKRKTLELQVCTFCQRREKNYPSGHLRLCVERALKDHAEVDAT